MVNNREGEGAWVADEDAAFEIPGHEADVWEAPEMIVGDLEHFLKMADQIVEEHPELAGNHEITTKPEKKSQDGTK